MNNQALIDIATYLMADDKGLIAMDESVSTCNKRFAKLAMPQTEEMRHDYRELIITTPVLGDCVSGAILFDETIRQQTYDGVPFTKVLMDAGILTAMKQAWGDRLTTIFPRQGHYGQDPQHIDPYPPADHSIEHIGDLLKYDFSIFTDPEKARHK